MSILPTTRKGRETLVNVVQFIACLTGLFLWVIWMIGLPQALAAIAIILATGVAALVGAGIFFVLSLAYELIQEWIQRGE